MLKGTTIQSRHQRRRSGTRGKRKVKEKRQSENVEVEGNFIIIIGEGESKDL